MPSPKLFFTAGCLGSSAVIFGAFGAHALKDKLTASGEFSVWEKAVQYHLIHAVSYLALVCLIASGPTSLDLRSLRRATNCWLAGVILFSGSVYGLALGGPRWLGPITPLGGLCFIAGWVFVAFAGKITTPAR